MRKAEEIPESEREYLVPGRKDVFKADGVFYVCMGKFAGWENPERLHILPGGNVCGASGRFDPKEVQAAARKILREGAGRLSPA